MNAPIAARHQADFLDLILVECPMCRGRAELRQLTTETRRLACTACFCIRTVPVREPGVMTYPTTKNICNGHALWLEAETRLGSLYAFNFDHLEYIAAYVAAPLRKVDFSKVSFRNSGITSRLPLWIKAAKNRDEVLKTIDRLRRK